MGAFTKTFSNNGSIEANVNLNDVLAMTIDGTEYYLTQNIDGVEFYISIND